MKARDNVSYIDSLYSGALIKGRINQIKLNIEWHKIEHLFVPLNDSDHWALIHAKRGEITTHDSMNSKITSPAAETLKKLLPNDWNIEKISVGECPQQVGCVDCGVHMLANLEFLSRGEKPQYTRESISGFRKQIRFQLSMGKIMKLEIFHKDLRPVSPSEKRTPLKKKSPCNQRSRAQMTSSKAALKDKPSPKKLRIKKKINYRELNDGM